LVTISTLGIRVANVSFGGVEHPSIKKGMIFRKEKEEERE